MSVGCFVLLQANRDITSDSDGSSGGGSGGGGISSGRGGGRARTNKRRVVERAPDNGGWLTDPSAVAQGV